MSDCRLLCELFTSNHLQRLAWFGWSEALSASIGFLERKWGLNLRYSPIAQVLEVAFETLCREHPIEYVYKASILKKEIIEAVSSDMAAMYLEFPVADARADLLLVNGKATVFEIKTRFDSSRRIENQLAEYYRCFKSVSVVVDEQQVERYSLAIPDYVGVVVRGSDYSPSVVRETREFKDSLDHASMFALFHQREYIDAVSEVADLSGIHPARRYQVALQHFRKFSVTEAYDLVVDALRRRQRTQYLTELCHRLPSCLHTSAFSYRIRKQDWDRLVGVISKPLSPNSKEVADVFPIPKGQDIRDSSS